MIIVSNDYWKDFGEQEIGSKPIDKVEIELSAGVWTDVTDNYIGGATFDQEKERAPDKISAGDTRYTFDNTDDKFTPRDSGSIFYNVIYQGKKIRFSEGFYGHGYYPQSVMLIKNIKWNYSEQRCYIFCQELIQRVVDEDLNIYPSALVPVANAGNTGNGTITEIATKPFITVDENWTLTGGYFNITDTNKFFDFDIGGAEKNATVATGMYYPGATQADAGTLCKALYDAIVAVEGAGTYTVSYSTVTQKFTITRSAGTFNILWKTGVYGSDNTDTHIGTILGYSDTADDTGALSYVSDNTTVGEFFDVVGSVSGDIGNAQVEVEFSNSTSGGIKFTISQGAAEFEAGDSFTFTTYQYPEFTTTNSVKIIWNLLTGYKYDTDVQSVWHDRVLEFDHTKSVDNTDINYTSFVNAIANVTPTLTGYIPYNKNAAEALEEVIIHFLGSLYTDNEGRIAISSYRPSFGGILVREFSDTEQVFEMDAEEDLAKIINKVTVFCKRSASFAWSNVDETTDDIYEASNSQSITDYGIKNPFVWTDYWYSASKQAQSWFADRIKDKFGGVPNLPLEIKFETGLDALRTNLADRRKFTDSRSSYSNKLLEIVKIEKDFESEYKTITLTGSNVGTEGIRWAFLGSSADEGDGISPQAANFDSATDTDKQFCYLSTTGSVVQPLYYLWGD